MVGKSFRTPSIGLVVRYWWAMGTMGMVTPTIRPMSGAQIPAAFTTTSHVNVPWSVTTSETLPALAPTAWTLTPVRTLTPSRRAPSARAYVSPPGSIWPSVGR